LACICTPFFTYASYVAKAVKQALLNLAFARLRGAEVSGLYAARNICPEGLFLVVKVFGWVFNGSNMKVTPSGSVKRSVVMVTAAMEEFIGDAGVFIVGVQGLTYVDKSGNIFSFMPVMCVEHIYRPAHEREVDGRPFPEENTCKITFSRAFVSGVSGQVNIPLDYCTNPMVVKHFKPTPIKVACLKLQLFLRAASRTTAVGSPPIFSAELKEARITFHLAAIEALLPAQLPHEAAYLEEVLDDLPLVPRESWTTNSFTGHLEMNTLALLQEEDKVVVVLLLTTRPPSMFIGPINDGDRCPIEEWPVPLETVSVHEYHAPQLSGSWVPIWEMLNSGSKNHKGDIKPGREGFNKFQCSKYKPGVKAIVPERWVFPESLAMLDISLSPFGRLPMAVVREFTAHDPDLPIW
jgi:hypothetical protein